MMRVFGAKGWRSAAALLVMGLWLPPASAAPAKVRLMVRIDEPDERVFVGDRRLVFKEGLATTEVPPGRVTLRRELGGVKGLPIDYDVDPTKIMRLPKWPRLAIDGLSERDRDSATLHLQPGVSFRPGKESPVPEGPVLVDLRRGGKVIETVEVPPATKERANRYMAWPLVAHSCETDEGAAHARELLDTLRDDAFLHVDLSLLPSGSKVRARLGHCEFKGDGGRLKLPPKGWRTDTIPVQVEGLGLVELAQGSGGEQRTLVDADIAAELCSSAVTRRDGERMAAAAAAVEHGGLEVRYDGFSRSGQLYLEAAECRLVGIDGVLRLPRRAFLERATLRFQPHCGTTRACLPVTLLKSMPTDPNGYPLRVDGHDFSGLEAIVSLHRVPLGALLFVDGMPAVDFQSPEPSLGRHVADGLTLRLGRGPHTIALEAPGRWPWQAKVDVGYGDRLDLNARLDLRRGGWTEWLGRGGLAAGTVGVVTVVAADVLARVTQTTFDTAASRATVAPKAIQTADDGMAQANTVLTVGEALFGLGAAAFATSSFLEPSGRETAPEWVHVEEGP